MGAASIATARGMYTRTVYGKFQTLLLVRLNNSSFEEYSYLCWSRNCTFTLDCLTRALFAVRLDFRSWWKQVVKSGLSVYHVRLASHSASGQNASIPPLVTDMMKVGQSKITKPPLVKIFFQIPRGCRLENVSVSLRTSRKIGQVLSQQYLTKYCPRILRNSLFYQRLWSGAVMQLPGHVSRIASWPRRGKETRACLAMHENISSTWI